jgi:hypothetical protein
VHPENTLHENQQLRSVLRRLHHDRGVTDETRLQRTHLRPSSETMVFSPVRLWFPPSKNHLPSRAPVSPPRYNHRNHRSPPQSPSPANQHRVFLSSTRHLPSTHHASSAGIDPSTPHINSEHRVQNLLSDHLNFLQ